MTIRREELDAGRVDLREVATGKRIPLAHPGEILHEEFLSPLGITQARLAEHIGVPARHISELIHAKRGVTPKTAWLLGQAFGTSPEFWLNLQATYDLAVNRPPRAVNPLCRVG